MLLMKEVDILKKKKKIAWCLTEKPLLSTS